MAKAKKSRRAHSTGTRPSQGLTLPQPADLNRPWIIWTVLTLVVVLGLVVRFTHLGADPPSDVSWSQDLLTDPPQYSSYARTAVVSGDWNPLNDDRLVFFQKNITGLLAYVVFSIFAPSVTTGNLTAVLFNIVAVTFLALGVARAFGWLAGSAAGLFLALNYLFVSYGRQPFLETGSNAMLAVAFWSIIASDRRWWLPLIGGLLAGAGTFFGKVTALHAAPVFVLALVFAAVQAKDGAHWKRWARPIGYLAAFAVVGALWYVVAYSAASEEVRNYLSEQSRQLYGDPLGLSSVGGFLDQWFTFGLNTGLWTWSPVLGALGFLGLTWMSASYARARNLRAVIERIPPAAVLTVGWLLVGYAGFSPFNYRPVRYQVVLLLPLAAAAGWVIYRVTRLPERAEREPVAWWVSPILVILITTGLYQLVFVHLLAGPRGAPTTSARTVSFVVALILSVGGIWLSQRHRAGTGESRPLNWAGVAQIATALLLLVVIVEQGRHFINWWGARQYTLQSANHDLGEVLGPGAVVTGHFAAPLTQDASHVQCLVHFFHLEEGPDFWQRFPITHIVVEDKPGEGFFAEYPELAQNGRRVATYTVRGARIAVIRVAELIDNPTANSYQLTPFERVQLDIRGVAPDSIPLLIEDRLAQTGETFSGLQLLGDAYYRIDDFDNALRSYLKAIERYPEELNLLVRAGDISWSKYRTSGGPEDRDTAARLWRRAARYAPGSRPLRDRLSQVGGA